MVASLPLTDTIVPETLISPEVSFIHTPEGEEKQTPTSLFSQLLNKFNASENPNDSMFIFLVTEMGLPFAKQMALILGWNVQNILDYIVAEGFDRLLER